MKIVIAGSGEVGSHLAKLLSLEDQDIIVVDDNAERLQQLDENYNLMTVQGSPMSFKVLKQAGVREADLFIAVTPYEECNITACSIANFLGVKRAVARIDNYEFMRPEYRDFFTGMGVYDVIYPEYLAAQEIKTSLKRGWARNWFELGDGELILLGVKVREGAAIVGHMLKDLTVENRTFHVSAIKRRRDTIIPRGNDTILPNDILYITTTRAHVDQVRELCGKKPHKIKSLMIMGGSRIAVRFADIASNDWDIKIIENDAERCRKLPELCPGCEIVHGDARDNDVLVDEGISDTDAFIALTDNSEANILACLTAKEYGVKKTIAEVENIQLIYEAEGLNIGTIINKKLIASSKIFQLLLDSDSESAKVLSLAGAEVAEIEVHPGARITHSQVKELKLPYDVTLGGYIRNGSGELVTGNTRFEPGDRVVVFCISGQLHKVEKLFL